MCGRYIILNGQKIFATTELLKNLDTKNIKYLEVKRYNASPTQKLPIVVNRQEILQPLEATWWLIPHWSKDGKPDMNFAIKKIMGHSSILTTQNYIGVNREVMKNELRKISMPMSSVIQ